MVHNCDKIKYFLYDCITVTLHDIIANHSSMVHIWSVSFFFCLVLLLHPIKRNWLKDHNFQF